MKSKYKISLLIAILIFTFTLVFKFYHPTDNRYRDDLIIGKTKEEIVNIYGEFDYRSEILCGYKVGTYNEVIFRGQHTIYYYIYFKNSKAYKIKIKERYGG